MKRVIFWGSILSLVLISTTVFAQNAVKSTIDDQTGMEVTVYNSNLGLIKDTRQVNLPAGKGELRFMDVAADIMPVTVHAKSLNFPDGFGILEQNYEYDLISQSKLLDKYVGKKVKILDKNEYQGTEKSVEATLLSNNENRPIYQIGSEIYLGHPGLVILPELPENLIAKPTLTWAYENTSKNPHQLEVSYLTSDINWKADYVVVVNKDDTMVDVSGWVTVDNKSGATYKDAVLKLIAGKVNRVQEQEDYGQGLRGKAMMMDVVAAPRFQEQAFFEYHIYDLEGKTTIKDNQTKQISLLKADKVKAKKELLVYGIKSYFTRLYKERNPKQPINVYMTFKNAKENNLGMPLPEGVMRLYKEDADKKLQFIGEDKIEHTPKDEGVRLKIGEAFDVVAERIQTDYKQVGLFAHESEWEITLRNHKETGVTVSLIEPVLGSWTVISNTHPFTKVDVSTIRFDVDVPKDGTVKVKYRIRVDAGF
ncbi:MAG TPA: DUF4139 domain-containing protein [Candidatus Omnitrophota bacterium]|nr:DUF4139 domain-containing protein [Candidatus Omnitrophota bacterium]HPD84326.1 DUF4139 domain-containing protein [Candidatus Omnitrophota bacterium]HRZ03184.1 DUF4139 domain-containing protein [Candidatus Omnitrophota bacterium]